jgi:hypothetical protein
VGRSRGMGVFYIEITGGKSSTDDSFLTRFKAFREALHDALRL